MTKQIVISTLLVVAVGASGHNFAQERRAASNATARAPRAEGTASTWTKKTAWGDPDLQGFWNNSTVVPIQRDPKFGTRTTMTEEEFKQIRDAAAAQAVQNEEAGDRVPNGPAGWADRERQQHLMTSQLIDPPDGRMPAMTPAAKAEIAMAGNAGGATGPGTRRLLLSAKGLKPDKSLWELQGMWVRCISRGALMGPLGYGNNYQVVQTPGYVAIHQEMVHNTRLIPLDGGPQLDPAIKQWNGASRGRWEGQTLVVTTTNFHPQVEPMDRGPSLVGGQATFTERFTRKSETDMDYVYTIDAPSTWVRPFTISAPMTTTIADDRIIEYACIEGDHSVRLTVTGLLAEMQKASAQATPGR